MSEYRSNNMFPCTQRANTPEYDENFDRIFGTKDDRVEYQIKEIRQEIRHANTYGEDMEEPHEFSGLALKEIEESGD
jgi:hypothetical protein